VLLGIVFVGIEVVSQYLHTKTMKDLGYATCNPSKPNDAHSLAIHVEAHQSVEFEIPFPRAVGRPIDLAVEAKHQRDSILCHCMG